MFLLMYKGHVEPSSLLSPPPSSSLLLPQDEVRIAKMEEPDPTEYKFPGLLPSWYHVECFLEHLVPLGAEGVGVDELTGFSKLKQPDKTELNKKFTAKTSGAKKGKG